jgi:Ca-activated chloride channel family protein
MSETPIKREMNAPLDSDDPRLTAYVLGELDEDACAEIERQLAEDPAGREKVEGIRQVAGLLQSELAREAAPSLEPSHRAAVEAAALHNDRPNRRGDDEVSRRRGRLATFVVASAATVVAATLLVLAIPTQTRQSSNSHYFTLESAEEMSQQVVLAERNEEVNNNGVFFQLEDAGDSNFRRPAETSQKRVAGPAPTRTEHARPQLRAWQSLGAQVTKAAKRSQPQPQSGENRVNALGQPIVELQTQVSDHRSTTLAPAGRDLSGYSVSDSNVPEKIAVDYDFNVQDNVAVDGASPAPSVPPAAAGTALGRLNVAPRFGTPLLGRGFSGTPLSSQGFSSDQYAQRRRVKYARSHEGRWGWYVPQTNLPTPADVIPGTESYDVIVENKFLLPTTDPLSTFSIDVDTAAYSNVRRFLNSGQLPPKNAVRIEELVNYFRYDDPPPTDEQPFSVHLEVGACPWNKEHRLVRVGLKGREIHPEVRPPSNLVFLIDVSGSMRDHNKLPLVKRALENLVREMTEDDRIAIVTYASSAGLLLESTSGAHRQDILSAIRNLQAGGSTNGEGGIRLAYRAAEKHFYKEGTNRVILCTDGDFNVGTSSDDALVALIEEKAKKSKVFLSICGFGMGNLKDAKLEKIADHGNGHYAYIDNDREARKVLVEELAGTLYTIAKDVKIQIEFNPAKVGSYRLIGYENRALANRDFADDTKDAGEIGAGHSVTALYEITPAGKSPSVTRTTSLKYQKSPAEEKPAVRETTVDSNELLTLKLRYKQPEGEKSSLLEFPLVDETTGSARSSIDFDWSAAVAAFGMILRESAHRGSADFALVLELANDGLGKDEAGHRREFIDMVRSAQAIRDGR